MNRNSLRLFRVGGIDIRIHASWLLVFALVTWSTASGYLPENYPGWPLGMYWAVGVLLAILLFSSVLVHEFSHSLVARSRGLAVDSITLFVFGGVSSIVEEPQTARTEFAMAIAGPISSFLIAAFAAMLSAVFGGVSVQLAATLDYLATINLLLGVFNLVPGFPLDGGRLLRSIIWRLTGDRMQATQIATGSGKIIAYGLVLLGLFQIASGNLPGRTLVVNDRMVPGKRRRVQLAAGTV